MFKRKWISYSGNKTKRPSLPLCSLNSDTRSSTLKASFPTDHQGGNPGSREWPWSLSDTLAYLQVSPLPLFCLTTNRFKLTISVSLGLCISPLFLSNDHFLNHCFTVFLPEKHPGTRNTERPHNAARAHSKSASCSRYCRARSKLLRTASDSDTCYTPTLLTGKAHTHGHTHMHTQRHIGVVILIHPPDRMLSEIRSIRGGAAVWAVSLSLVGAHQLNFVSPFDKNLVCKQALQSSLITNRVVFSSSGGSSSIGCEGTTTLQWKVTAEDCQKVVF